MNSTTTGSTVTLPSATPTMSGYKFDGWCSSSVLPDARDGITYNVGKLADGKCWMLDNLAFNGKDEQGNGSYITMDKGSTGVWWSTTAFSSTHRYRLYVDTSGIYPADRI